MMEPLQDLLDKHADPLTDKLDLQAVIDEMTALLEKAAEDGFAVQPVEMILINERHVDTMIDYLGNLFLSFADELGALPEGAEVEAGNFQLFKTHSKVSAVYELARTKAEIVEARSGLVVPSQTGSVNLDDIRGEDDA